MSPSVSYSTPIAPPPDRFNLAEYVLAKTDEHPDKTALAILSTHGTERWSYYRLRRAVQGIAAGFRKAGLRPGDRVLMRIGNEVAFPLCYLGAIWAGCLPVPASAALTRPEITRLAAELDPKCIVSAPGISLPEPAPCPVLTTDALREMERETGTIADLGSPDRPAFIVYTSGTSGNPRGVLHAHRSIWARRMMWDAWYGLTPSDRVLHAGAFNWTYTLGTGLLDPWTRGGTALIPGQGTEVSNLPLLFKRFDATIFAAAPGIYRRLLAAHPQIDAPRLRHGLTAGEHLAPRIRDAWQIATGTALHEALGMSECSTFVSGSPDRPAPLDAVGFAQPGRHVAVLGNDGAPVQRGTIGTLAIHRSDPGLMLRYLNAPKETSERHVGDWFLTGDSVSMAEDGAITYHGRGDDMMNAGGVRVSPIEVETVLMEHPGITDVACRDVEVKADTTVIAAFYSGPAPIPEDRLKAFAAERLARYKQPRLYLYRDSLPRTNTGKLHRKALRP